MGLFFGSFVGARTSTEEEFLTQTKQLAEKEEVVDDHVEVIDDHHHIKHLYHCCIGHCSFESDHYYSADCSGFHLLKGKSSGTDFGKKGYWGGGVIVVNSLDSRCPRETTLFKQKHRTHLKERRQWVSWKIIPSTWSNFSPNPFTK